MQDLFARLEETFAGFVDRLDRMDFNVSEKSGVLAGEVSSMMDPMVSETLEVYECSLVMATP